MARAIIFDMFETLITHYNTPLYFGAQMAQDAGISVEYFRSIWRSMEAERTVGKLTLEQTLEIILRENTRDSEELIKKIASKRIATCEDCFCRLHPEIIPMLIGLKEQGFLIGLISNCFSEEAEVIRRSELISYFDAVCLSYELGIKKPDEAIYRACTEQLGVLPTECIYVGDGGSNELEAAKAIGMEAIQATWYLKEGTFQPTGRIAGFCQIEAPLEVIAYAKGRY